MKISNFITGLINFAAHVICLLFVIKTTFTNPQTIASYVLSILIGLWFLTNLVIDLKNDKDSETAIDLAINHIIMMWLFWGTAFLLVMQTLKLFYYN